jgi:hypothetical protein
VVVGRASAFADREIIKMAQNDFIPVAADDWYQRRRKDKEGDFFRKSADALGKTGEGGSSRQGIYCFAADGTPLAYKNASQDADITRQTLQEALFKFDKLPEQKRKPGAVKVEEAGLLDPAYSRSPPEGGLILKVFTRILDYKSDGYSKGSCSQPGGDKAARDHMWITAEEVRALAPAKATVGFRYPLPPKIAERLTCYHLVNNTRGEPILWRREEIRAKRYTLTVIAQTPTAIDLRLEGEALLASDADLGKADRGYEVRLVGNLRYLPAAKTFDRFDIAAVGSHWGEAFHAGVARPGKSLLGVSFELAGDRPGDKVAPQGIRDRDEYFGKQ